MFRVPFDLKEAFGRARPPVKVTIRGHTWRTTPGVYGGVAYIGLNRGVKSATGVDAGERVRVELELDEEPRTVRVPADLRERAHRRPGREGGLREAVVHALPRVRRVDRGGEAARDASAASRADRRARPSAGRSSEREAASAADTVSIGTDDARGSRGVGHAASQRGRRARRGRVRPLVDFFVDAGLDGILALGTAGEGILLEEDERRLVADLFLQAAAGRLQVAVQCGAQSTAETVRLAAHAAEIGAGAVVVIGPPYFRLDEKAQYAHFLAAALACAPLPVLRVRVRVDERIRRRAGRPPAVA